MTVLQGVKLSTTSSLKTTIDKHHESKKPKAPNKGKQTM